MQSFRALRRWLSFTPMAILAILVLCAVFAPQIAPHSPVEARLSTRLAAPAWYSPCEREGEKIINALESCSVNGALLGTDNVGRDVLSRTIYGARKSLSVAILSIVIAAIFGSLLGLAGGAFQRLTSGATSKRFDAVYAIAYIQGTLFLGLAIVVVFGFSLLLLAFALALGSWVEIAAHMSRLRMPNTPSFRRQLPVVAKLVVAASVRQLGLVILAANMLFYLGIGVRSLELSWGGDVAIGRAYLGPAWWVAFFPAMAIFLTVLSCYLAGTWLRDRWVAESVPDTMAAAP